MTRDTPEIRGAIPGRTTQGIVGGMLPASLSRVYLPPRPWANPHDDLQLLARKGSKDVVASLAMGPVAPPLFGGGDTASRGSVEGSPPWPP